MEALKRVIRFQNQNLLKSAVIFWGVVLIVNLLASFFLIFQSTSTKIVLLENSGFISIAGSNLFAVFIFLIVYGIIMYYEDFAMALYCGVARKDFYKGVIIRNFLMVLMFAIIQAVLLFIEKFSADLLGYPLLVEFGIFNTSTDSIFFVAGILFLLFFTTASISNLMGVLQFRYGYRFWIGFGVVMLGLVNYLTIATCDFEINPWSSYLSNTSALLLTSLFITTALFAIGYPFIRAASISK